eukprot:g19208.t1
MRAKERERQEQEELERQKQEFLASLPERNEDDSLPTRLIAACAYMLPLLDAAERFGWPLALMNPTMATFMQALNAPMALLSAVPFGLGFLLVFIGMQFVANNPENPALVRYNMSVLRNACVLCVLSGLLLGGRLSQRRALCLRSGRAHLKRHAAQGIRLNRLQGLQMSTAHVEPSTACGASSQHSTCWRVFVPKYTAIDRVNAFLREQSGLDSEELDPYLFNYSGHDAINHLFEERAY